MSTLWKLLLLLTVVYATGKTLRYEAAPQEATPVQPAGTIPEDGYVVATAPHSGCIALALSPDDERRASFGGRRFAEVLGEHDAFLPHLAHWRRMLAAHASALAGLVKTFPGTEPLSEQRIREVLHAPSGLSPQSQRGDVFRPWAGRWSGQWGDGSPQYHIWDPSRCHEGRQVQFVAQSEKAFPEAARLETMVRHNQADLAVNVFSERFGITGWVSKRQHGPLGIPCLGYLLEPALLLWICQTSGTPRKALAQDGWFAYLESVEASGGSSTYHIYGHAVEITRRGIRYGALTPLHTGHYQAK